MLYLFKMPKRRTFGDSLTSSEDKLFFIKKEDMSSKKKTYGNSTSRLLIYSRLFIMSQNSEMQRSNCTESNRLNRIFANKENYEKKVWGTPLLPKVVLIS